MGILLLLLACTRPPEPAEAPPPAEEKRPALPSRALIGPKHLSGGWRSADDPAKALYIEKTTWAELEGEKETRRAVFELADGCRPGGRPSPDGEYLNLLEKSGPTCFRVLKADGQVLELALQPGGEVRRYTHIAPPQAP